LVNDASVAHAKTHARRSRPDESENGDRGSVAAQLVIATPLLLLLLLMLVQFATWFHASHIAQMTAAQALSAARAENGSAAAGRAQADALLGQLGTGLLLSPQVSVTRTGGDVQAEVTGIVQAVVPGLHLPVRAVAAGPVDAWTKP
jgi:Flp pilus assembly protein TadG